MTKILYVDRRFTSPYAMSAFVSLRAKRIDVELRTLDIHAGEQHDAPYARISQTARVPTLVDGSFALSESSAISEYLDEAYSGTPLYPLDIRLRAVARQIQAWLRSDLMPIREERSAEVIFYRTAVTELSDDGRAAARKLIDAASRWLEHDEPHLFGAWCIADTDLAVMLNRLRLAGDALPTRLARYADAQWRRPAIQEWVAFSRP